MTNTTETKNTSEMSNSMSFSARISNDVIEKAPIESEKEIQAQEVYKERINAISDSIKKMKFKKKFFGGFDPVEVYYNMKALNDQYQQLVQEIRGQTKAVREEIHQKYANLIIQKDDEISLLKEKNEKVNSQAQNLVEKNSELEQKTNNLVKELTTMKEDFQQALECLKTIAVLEETLGGINRQVQDIQQDLINELRRANNTDPAKAPAKAKIRRPGKNISDV